MNNTKLRICKIKMKKKFMTFNVNDYQETSYKSNRKKNF